MSQLIKLKIPFLALVVSGLLVAIAPAPAEAQPGPRHAVPRPVHGPVYRPIVHHYAYPYYWSNIWWASYGHPWGFNFSFGFPYYGYPYYAYPYPYGYYATDITTAVRMQASRRDAEVFVDGYSAGVVDDFDGVFQRLRLQPGGHEIAVYLDGHRTFRQNLYLNPGASQTIRPELQPLAPGETMEARPSPSDDRSNVPRSAPPDGRPDPQSRPDPPGERDRPAGDEPRRRFGTLSIRVQPADAEIFVDGERWTAPADSTRIAIELAQGRHIVEVRKSGFSIYREDVLIRPGATTNVNVSLSVQ